jgi:hypothetical protein
MGTEEMVSITKHLTAQITQNVNLKWEVNDFSHMCWTMTELSEAKAKLLANSLRILGYTVQESMPRHLDTMSHSSTLINIVSPGLVVEPLIIINCPYYKEWHMYD